MGQRPHPMLSEARRPTKERILSVEGWGWGREVGAGVPRSRAGWCQVPGSGVVQPEPWANPTVWLPLHVGSRAHRDHSSCSLCAPPCSLPEQNAPRWARMLSLHLNPAPPSPQMIQGARAGACGSLRLLALLPPAAWLAPRDSLSPLCSWQPCSTWSSAIQGTGGAGPAYRGWGLCAANVFRPPCWPSVGRGQHVIKLSTYHLLLEQNLPQL